MSRVAHPVVWALLYLPFGALSGFVSIGLGHVATERGLDISEGALLTGVSLLSQWLKWLWAPAVDVTLTPKRWYVIGTASTAIGTLLMSALPMDEGALPTLLAVIGVTSLLNSVVGMAIEAIMAAVTPPEQRGAVSGWFQAGNLGGGAIAGFLGLEMLLHLPAPWMAGAVLGALFLSCNALLWLVPDVAGHRSARGPLGATADLLVDLRRMAATRGGLLSMILCFLPIGTGAGLAVLAQAAVARQWQVGGDTVAWVQGLFQSFVIAGGALLGGWLCDRMPPRTAYAGIGLLLATVGAAMAVTPMVPASYVVWNLAYAFVVGMAYAAFTAVVLAAIGTRSGATKYSIFASLSNFPIWWLGLLLGWVADHRGVVAALWTESWLAVAAVLLFWAATRLVARSRLPEQLED